MDEVPDPAIKEPTDAIIRVTTTGLCGSDLHLYGPLAPLMTAGDVIGHEPMGVVEEVGASVTELQMGDRVVVPFNISCGECWTCNQGLHSQCETTQNHDTDTGASLLGYSTLVGVYGGATEPMPMMQMFDKQIQLRMGQANVRRWSDDIMPLLTDDSDPLGTESFATHRLPLVDAPEAYAKFRDKQDAMIKVLFNP